MFHIVALKEYFNYVGGQQEHTGVGLGGLLQTIC